MYIFILYVFGIIDVDIFSYVNMTKFNFNLP
jgi:hypothetical protein